MPIVKKETHEIITKGDEETERVSVEYEYMDYELERIKKEWEEDNEASEAGDSGVSETEEEETEEEETEEEEEIEECAGTSCSDSQCCPSEISTDEIVELVENHWEKPKGYKSIN